MPAARPLSWRTGVVKSTYKTRTAKPELVQLAIACNTPDMKHTKLSSALELHRIRAANQDRHSVTS